MAKKTRRKATRTKAAAKPGRVARKQSGTKKPAAGKTANKTVKRAARKPAKARVTAKTSRPARKKTAAKAAGRGAQRTSSTPAGADLDPTRLAVGVAAADAPVRRPRSLSRKDLAQFRELLLVKRGELVADVSTLQNEALRKNRREASGDLSSMPIHMADLGTDNYEKEFTLGLIEGSRAVLREIDEALARIEDGTYGVCQATGKPIGKARLRARPWAKFCYEYVLAQERGQQESGL